MDDHTTGRSFGLIKPKSTKAEVPYLVDSSGYNPKRQEFDPEYDNDAEQMLADMEFEETDTEEERQLKLRVLGIYSKRLDERKRRKDFILERNLLHPSPFDDLSQEEKELCRRYDVFMRFHSKDKHEELLKTLLSEHRILKRIRQLKEARAAGCRSSAEADRYLEQKRREGDGDGANRKESSQTGSSSQESLSVPYSFGTYSTTTSAGQANSSTDFDFGANLLSESEKQLCREMRLSPQHYLKIQEDMTTQITSGNITKKSDAHSLFPVEPSKIDKVYDMLLKKVLFNLDTHFTRKCNQSIS